jgi:hypothetical protein
MTMTASDQWPRLPHRVGFAILALIATMASAEACAPAPSCWLESSPSYLQSVCRSQAKASEIVLDEPERLLDFIKACKKLGINVEKKIK